MGSQDEVVAGEDRGCQCWKRQEKVVVQYPCLLGLEAGSCTAARDGQTVLRNPQHVAVQGGSHANVQAATMDG